MRFLFSLGLPLLMACSTTGGSPFAQAVTAGSTAATPRQADALAHYMAALMHQRNGRYEEYIDELSKAHRLAPESTSILARLGEAYMRKQDFPNARDAYEKAVKQTPDDAVLWVWLGVALQQLNDYDRAAESFQKAIELAPENPLGYQALIDAETSANDYVAAVEVYQKLVQLRPDSAELRMHLGGGLARIKDTEGARQALEKAIELDPKLGRARFALAFILLDMNKGQEAAKHFEEYLEDNPDDGDGIEGYAGALVRMGDFDRAANQMTRLIESGQAEPVHYIERVYLLIRAGKAKEAAALNPTEEAPYFGTLLRAVARKTAGEPYRPLLDALDEAEGDVPGEAREFLGEMLSLFGHDETGQYLVQTFQGLRGEGVQSKSLDFFLARTLSIMKRYAEAEPVLVAAIGRSARDKWLLYELAGTYDQMDNFDQAAKYLQECLALDPDDPEILNFLGYLYAERGVKLDEAQQLIEKALAQETENPFYLDSLGWVHYQKGDSKKAVELIRKAIFLMESDDAVLRDHLGDAYLKNGEKEKAIAEWRRAHRLDPELEGVQDKLNRYPNQAKND